MLSTLPKINFEDLENISGKKLLLRVDTKATTALEWAEENREKVESVVKRVGALVVRGLDVSDEIQFAELLKILFNDELIDYNYRSTPRTELKSGIYTATEYHPSETIPQHSENAYSNKWPMRLGLMCMIPASKGGETPLACNREIYKLIPNEIRDKFEKRGVMYVRNYGQIDLPWTEVFQTDDRQLVEQYCNENDIQFEWLPDNRLRTKQINKATAKHPVTGDMVWFNQAHLFHYTSMERETREALMTVFGQDGLPRNTYFGDGSPIDESDLDIIRSVYDQCTIAFPWQKNDLILVDNMLVTHGRRPFEGERKVVVGMAQEMSWKKMA